MSALAVPSCHSDSLIPRDRRYLSGQAHRYAAFLKAAEDYARGFADRDDAWMFRKPFDDTPGNAYFYLALYNLLNILRVMKLPHCGRVLEVGCGPGWLTEILLGLGHEVVALDPSASMIRVARSRLSLFAGHHRVPEPLRVEFRCEPLEECGLPDESVDGVLFYESLHHIVDERAGLALCFRVLRPGGVVGVTSEAAWRPGVTELEAAIEKEMAEHGTLENPFNPDYLDYLLRAAGFEAPVRYHGVNGFFPADQGGRSVADVSDSRAEGTNHLTATKPAAQPTTANGRGRTAAVVRVRTATRAAQRDRAALGLELVNTGETVWLRHHPSGGGHVMVALFRGTPGRPDFAECGHRLLLPHNVGPGERIEFEGTFALPGTEGDGGWHIGLVCENRFWFTEHGCPAAPVLFAAQ